MHQVRVLVVVLLVSVVAGAPSVGGRSRITTPKEHLGFNLGDDYMLATYSQLTSYWRALDRESDRMTLVEIGKTAEGRPQWMAILTSAENHRRLARYKDIAKRLALAEGVDDEAARRLAAEGRAVVWIDGGLHASETLGAQQLMELVYQMTSRTDEETLRFLNDVILLAVHANPDGHELVANWYMREREPARRSLAHLPRLYQKHAGHDNNRDSYMANLPETENMNRVLYREWFPQIMYNHHQAGPRGTVLFAPPFRDPFNYVYDPLVPLGIDLVGAAMHNRFVAEGKPGATMRRGASYSTWWNGGLRTTTYFHNMIGLLTETIGSPTPMEIPFEADRLLPSGDLPYPIAPQRWHFRQSIEYSITANRAVLDVASRHREQFLFNIYRMGKNAIERGSRDHWTAYPRHIDALKASLPKESGPGAPIDAQALLARLHTPERRDPRGYILPSSQPDFLTAVKFANALLKAGVQVDRATAPFTVQGRSYPAGSLVVRTAQAFRPHVLDMFEPQDHPNDFRYPGGPPIPPYDSAGWTLAYQMGVVADRVLDSFDGPFERVADVMRPPPGRITGAARPAAYVFPREVNDAVVAVNRLLARGESVHWIRDALTANGVRYGPGAFVVLAKPTTLGTLQALASNVGLSFQGLAERPTAPSVALRAPRVALADVYGGSMTSGWVRLLLERFEFSFEVVYPPAIDRGTLTDRFDVLILTDGLIGRAADDDNGSPRQDVPLDRIPPEYRDRVGQINTQKTIPRLRSFAESGGTIVAIGSSTALASHFGLPLESALVETGENGRRRPLPREKYFVPGSVLQVAVDPADPLAAGLPSTVDVFFDRSPVFRPEPGRAVKGVRKVAWFMSHRPLRSGWAWGQHYLKDGIAVAAADVGRGQLLLFGPEITFRAQPHGTFKFLFNGIYLASQAAERTPTH
jgi:hypothetical protein